MIGLTPETARRVKQLVSDRRRQIRPQPPVRPATTDRGVWVVSNSATPAGGSGLDAQCYAGTMVEFRGDQLASVSLSPVWITPADSSMKPTVGLVYSGTLLGRHTIAADSRPRVQADVIAYTDFGSSGIVSGFNDQYIGGDGDVKQLHYLSFSGAVGAKQGFDSSEVILDALMTNLNIFSGSAIINDWSGLHVRTGDRFVGNYQNVIAQSITLPDVLAASGPQTWYGRIEYRTNATNSGGNVIRSSPTNNPVNRQTVLAVLGLGEATGSGTPLAVVPPPGNGITGDHIATLWVYGVVGAQSGFSTVGDIGGGVTFLSGWSVDMAGLKFRSGLLVAGSLSVNLASQVTGTLSVGNGGTGAISFATGEAIVGNGTGGLTTLPDLVGSGGKPWVKLASGKWIGFAVGSN